MKWITREKVKVDRVACPWLIKKFVDKDAEFVFVPGEKVMTEAQRLDAIPYDVRRRARPSRQGMLIETVLKKYKLTADPALVLSRASSTAPTPITRFTINRRVPVSKLWDSGISGSRTTTTQCGGVDRLRRTLRVLPGMVKRGKPHGEFMS